MARMTRTQISLHEGQYQFAKRQAAERGISLSSYLRALIDERMGAEATSNYDIMDLAGLFEDGGVTPENVDVLLADEALGLNRNPAQDDE
ncbi:MAG TPA: hypothetical protein VFE20_09195 [Thermoleophilia bacterium]|nr:hypothetical protein [Thermoleophilia bacterium]